MQINRITTKYTPTTFRSNIFDSFPSSSAPKKRENDPSYIMAGLAGLAVLSVTAIIAGSLNGRNTVTAHVAKKTVKKAGSPKLPKTNDQIILQRLHGKRDFRAKTLYKAYRSKEKMESLLKRYFAGEFSPEVMPYIKENNKYLQRMASSVL